MLKSTTLLFCCLTLFLCACSAENEPKFKTRELPVLSKKKLTVAERKAFEKKPENKIKGDYKPSSEGKVSQSKNAGKSYLKVSSQIIGGAPAAPKQFPWQVYLFVDKAYICGGSLIAADRVLTAAHCVYGHKSFEVSVGGVDRTKPAETGEQSVTSTNATYHKNYNDNTLVNDIAIIRLPSSFTLNEYVNIIQLPTLSDVETTFEGKPAVASGYGKTSNKARAASAVMNYVTLLIIPNAQCAQVYGTTSVISSTICTSDDRKKQICSGDSGGPLIFKKADNSYMQIGVVSFGAAGGCAGNPAGFARVTSFLGFISDEAGIAIAP